MTTLDKSLSSVLVTNATSSTPPLEVRVTKAEVRLPDTTNHCLARDLELVASVNGSIAIPSVVTTAHTQISYTAAQLFYYGEVTTVPLQRCVRKKLFTLNLWRPSVKHHKRTGANHRNLVNVVNNSQSLHKRSILHIGCLNAQSVKNKALSISEFLVYSDLDILGITETWLGTSMDDQCLQDLVPSGWKIINVPRPDHFGGGGHGGVAIVFKEGLNFTLLESSTNKV